MNKREQKKQIKRAVAYGMGYVCGKHNLKVSRKEIMRAIKGFNKAYKTKE